MKRLSFIYRSLIIPPMILTVVCFAVNCTRRESKRDDPESGISSEPKANDKCSACLIDSFYVKQSPTSDRKNILIDEPVAVQFFNQVHLIDKYEKGNYDTLMKLFKMSHWSDRNIIYALKDQYFYFERDIRPILIENSIKIIDSVPNDCILEFRVSDATIFVDPKNYNNQDGVLLFIPGKKPVYWTADREEINCKNSQGFVEQYFLCRGER